MKWTHATGLISTFALIAAGAFWAGCSGDDNKTDGGTDGGGNDATSQDSGGGDTGTTDSGGLAVDASVLDCTYYCTNIMAACTGSNQQYLDQATCMTMCNEGIPNEAGAGATSGDSLACRMYHLSVAAQGGATAATHCPHAGPFGYDMCGGQCEDFCHQWFASNCSGNTDPDAGGYSNEAECLSYCGGAGGADAAAGSPGTAQSTPAILCKEYHLENAIKTGGATGGGHCGHAGANSAGGTCPN